MLVELPERRIAICECHIKLFNYKWYKHVQIIYNTHQHLYVN